MLLPRDARTLFVCGTNAFSPVCRTYQVGGPHGAEWGPTAPYGIPLGLYEMDPHWGTMGPLLGTVRPYGVLWGPAGADPTAGGRGAARTGALPL